MVETIAAPPKHAPTTASLVAGRGRRIERSSLTSSSSVPATAPLTPQVARRDRPAAPLRPTAPLHPTAVRG
jgi:hypothetical protein